MNIADTMDRLIDNLHNQHCNARKSYFDTLAFNSAREKMKEQENQLLKMIPDLPSPAVEVAVNELLVIAEDRILDAELHGFQAGFRAALRFQDGLKKWILSDS